jgi:hypothetical protein
MGENKRQFFHRLPSAASKKNKIMKSKIWTILAIGIMSCNPKSPHGNTTAETDYLSVEELEKKGFEIFSGIAWRSNNFF